MPVPETEILNAIVGRVLRYSDVTVGEAKQGFFFRYRGQLVLEPEQAYDQLAEAVLPYNLLPLFRKDQEGRHIILLVEPPALRKAPKGIRLNVIMFALTILSVMLAGAQVPEGTPIPADAVGQIKLLVSNLFSGWPFALAMLSILLAHEMGHYLAGRRHKVDVSLPFFIPLPLSMFGTMGAFINMRSIPRNKRHLLDIGIAGPLAGLAVAIPVLLIGLSLSQLGPVVTGEGAFIEGNSLLYLLAKFAIFGQWLPAPSSFAGSTPLLYWLSFFFTGTPLPIGGVDVFIHPVALAGWAGLLVTSLNLIPAGQFDGGHILYTLFGDRLRKALPFIAGTLVVMGWFWNGWWLWAAILLLFGRVHAEPLDQITELDPRRKLLAWLMIVVFLVTLAPVPMVLLP